MMATLDVERVIRSPLFTSPCKLIHFVEGLDKFGNPTWTEGETADVMAVITADTKTISRLPEALRREGTILVRFMIADMPKGFGGSGNDEVEWRGKRFVVKDCADYSQFGKGFLRLTCWPAEVSDGSY
jgi:hypothetical protein|nr:MAG TPA: hypothetical protein [Caudoviricetes sp.]